jgi:uncharacterized protein with NRDE domain
MPYNSQLMIMKAEESEQFWREKATENEEKAISINERLEEAFETQHELENIIEEYEVSIKKREEHMKKFNLKFQDLQKRYSSICSSHRELKSKVGKLELEKQKLSEKWIKLSAKNKTDGKVKEKLKDLEILNDK